MDQERIRSEMLESLDEELEMEIDDERLAELLRDLDSPDSHARSGALSARLQPLDRRFYFRELFRLQGDLVEQIPP